MAIVIAVASLLLTSCASWTPSAEPLRVPPASVLRADADALSFCGDLRGAAHIADLVRHRGFGIGSPTDWMTNYRAWATQYEAESIYNAAAASKAPDELTASALRTLASLQMDTSTRASAVLAGINRISHPTEADILHLLSTDLNTKYAVATGSIQRFLSDNPQLRESAKTCGVTVR